MKRLVVLRPEPGASATVRKARELGLDAVAAPLFEIRPKTWDLPDLRSFDGLLLTSANAVRHGGERLRDCLSLPVHAVGEATAAAARAAGFQVATAGRGGVDALLASLAPGLRLLHLAGEERRVPSAPAQVITAVTVYGAAPVEPPAAIRDLEGGFALIHSPRAGARLAELRLDRAHIGLMAISPAAAEACGTGWGAVHVAERPDDAALLSLAAQLCQASEPE